MKRLGGIFLVALSAAAFGTLAIFGRYAYADGLDTFTILFLRFSLAAILMLALLFLRRESLPRGLTLMQLIGMGAFGYVGQAFFYFTALKFASAGTVALLLYLYPLFVTLLSAFFLHEHITRWKILSLSFALLGTALIAGPMRGQAKGIMMAISAALIYSTYILVGTQVMKQVSAVQSSLVIFAAAGVTSGGLMAINGPHFPATGAGWLVIAAIVLIATALPVVTFLAGLERIGATNTAMLSTLEPVVTVLLAMLLLNETLKPLALLGGGMILGAVLLLTLNELQRARPVSTDSSTLQM